MRNQNIFKWSKIVFPMLAGLGLVGCGGGGTSEIGTAYYVDAPVVGVYYKCGSQEGQTKAKGKFLFEKGKSCAFYLMKEKNFPFKNIGEDKLVDGDEVQETNATVARMLQALDNGATAGEITIDDSIVDALRADGVIELPDTASGMATFFTAIGNAGGDVPTEEEAVAHLERTMGVILDHGTTWEDTIHTVEQTNWDDAVARCNALEHAGLEDWTVPVPILLEGLHIDRFVYSREGGNTEYGPYWTSREQSPLMNGDYTEAFIVNFAGDGIGDVAVGHALKSNDSGVYVRCVSSSVPIEELPPVYEACREFDVSWYREVSDEVGTYATAVAYCEAMGAELPTIDDMRTLWEHNSTHPANAVGLWTSTFVDGHAGEHQSVYFNPRGLEQIPFEDTFLRSYMCVQRTCADD